MTAQNQFHFACLFERVAAAIPDRIAVESDAGALTFAELDARSDRFAAGLAARGVKRGEAIGLYLMNGPEYLECFLGACKLGAIPFNVNYRYGGEELRSLLENANAAAVVFNPEFEPIATKVRASLPGLKLLISIGQEAIDKAHVETYDAVLASPARKGFEREESDLLLLYTGGTTGMPKGVMWPHKAFFFACLGGGGHYHPAGAISEPAEIAARAREGYRLKMFPIAPLMHGAAIWSAASALLGGVTVVVDPMRAFDPEAIWDRVERVKVNIIQIVGDAMARPLYDALRDNPGRWSLDHVVNFGSGGAVFSDHLKAHIQAFLPKASITDGMGSSESGIAGAAKPSPDGMLRLVAHADQQVIVDGRFAEIGETGLLARAGHIPVGYYRDPKKTAEVFLTVDGRLWSAPGDLARLDPDGVITVFGRGSTCINTGGEKVFPEEVESAIRAHPAIQDVAVVGKPHERWGEAVVAVASLTPGAAPISIQTLRDFLGPSLAAYKHPKELFIVDKVQRSAAGKQDYKWAKSVIADRASL